MKNTLYYGDNLEVLRKYIPDECVDLVYLDPPFNSNQDYNVLFRERDGAQSHAQVKAFEDTWTWDQEAAYAYETTVEQGGDLASIGLDGPDGSHLTVIMIICDSTDSANDAYASIRQDYYYMGGSDDLGIGNRSCYIRMAWTDTGTDAYILAAFQKANVVVEFDFVPGYADLSLSDLKEVAREQYDKIQN